MQNKRTLFLIIFILFDLLVILGGLYWWFFLRAGQPFAVRDILPADTVLYLELKDVAKLKEDFKKTAYSKIWNDPGVKEFIDPMMKKSDGIVPGKLLNSLDSVPAAKPGMPQVPRVEEISKTIELMTRHLPVVLQKEAVIALAEVKISPPKLTVILAYDYDKAAGSQKEFETALKGLFKGFQPAADKKIKGVKIESAKSPQGILVAKALFGTTAVYSISTDTKILEDMIERRKSGKKEGSLGESARFKQALGRVAGDYASLVYINLEVIVEMAKPFMGLMPSGKSTLEQIQPYKAVLATTTILPDGMLKEQMYTIMPAAERPEYMKNPGVLEFKTMPLTSEASKVYLANRSGSMVGMYDFMMKQAYKGDPMGQQTVQNLESMFAARGINLRDDFFAALGDESAFIVDWAPGQIAPGMFLAQQVSDAGKLRATVDKLTVMLQEFGGKELVITTTMNSAGLVTYSIPIGGTFAILSPTISVTDDYLFVANSVEALETALTRSQTPGQTLQALPAYTQALKQLPPGGYSVGYLDSKELFSRVYEMIRTYAMLAGMFSPADPESGLDLKKIPPTASFANYLSSSVSTEIADEGGLYSEKISSLGNQVYGLVAIVAAGVVLPNLDKIKANNPLSNKKPMPGTQPLSPPAANIPPENAQPAVAAQKSPQAFPVAPELIKIDSILFDPATGEGTVTMNKTIVVDKGEEFDFPHGGDLLRLKVTDLSPESVTIQDTATGSSLQVPYTPKQ